MARRISIKLIRTSGFETDDYGPAFERELNALVGGKDKWHQPPTDHRTAEVPKSKVKVRRCEDGPEFYDLANLAIAAGGLLINAITLWYSLPKREKEQNGERFIEVRTPDFQVLVKASGSAASRKKKLQKILKALDG